jgi:aminoglycoside/choline kinase family phosphotransferase
LESIDTRKNSLTEWLGQCGIEPVALQAMVNDASFRRYFRVYTHAGSYVAMDAPAPHENCESFVAIAKALHKLGLHTPEIIAANIEQGFLLLTDFGDITYLSTLNQQNADELYRRALSALAVLQSCREVPGRIIPPFNRDFMWREWAWHKEWFMHKLLGLSLGPVEKELDRSFALIVDAVAIQPQVFMHRDYHSANLMVLPSEKAVGILDFQDAFIGPITYDAVSLLRDCYIDWPNERVASWVIEYWRELNHLRALTDVSPEQFLRWFDWMGMQRHLKALLTFARKHERDQQSNYLKYIPRTLGYLLSVSERYPQFAVLHDYLHKTVQPAFKRVRQQCAV